MGIPGARKLLAAARGLGTRIPGYPVTRVPSYPGPQTELPEATFRFTPPSSPMFRSSTTSTTSRSTRYEH
eukprot:780617-Rhodomonas_salina.2